MPCGPMPRSGGNDSPVASGDPFSFAPGGALFQGMTTWATMWSAPWRAVAIVAEEALREGGGRRG